MQPFIQAKQEELTSLCPPIPRPPPGIVRLRGSGWLEPASSDLDFLVEFEELDPPAYADAYFGL